VSGWEKKKKEVTRKNKIKNRVLGCRVYPKWKKKTRFYSSTYQKREKRHQPSRRKKKITAFINGQATGNSFGCASENDNARGGIRPFLKAEKPYKDWKKDALTKKIRRKRGGFHLLNMGNGEKRKKRK